MTIFRLNFLLKVGQMKVCQNPSFISTLILCYPNIWVFIAQLVEHCSANAEAMGSNPVEAPHFFFRA